jgi:hypothetical protein
LYAKLFSASAVDILSTLLNEIDAPNIDVLSLGDASTVSQMDVE